MSIRKLFFWAHLVVGVIAGLVILTMAATGILIAYQKQIVGAAERGIANIGTIAPGTQPVSIGEFAKKVGAAFPNERPTAIAIRRDTSSPVVVNLGRERAVLAHPVTGEILGEGSKWRGFLHQVEQIHRNLAVGPNGKMITGAASIAFLFLLLSGLYLWIPKKWNKANLKPALIPSIKLSGKARHWNWHNSFGFWAALPLMLSILTGMVISYKWANDLLFRLTGNEPPPPRVAAAPRAERSEGAGRGERGAGREGNVQPFRVEGLNAMWATAVDKAPAWQTITLRFGENPGVPLIFIADEGNSSRPDQRAQLTFNAKTGEIQKFEPYASHNLGRQIRMWVKPLHTGEALGIVGQTIAAFGAAAALILVWTGFGLALRRFRQRRRGAATAGSNTALDQSTEALADATAATSESK
jgi:uncharacterized iron-regulated membrane protein